MVIDSLGIFSYLSADQCVLRKEFEYIKKDFVSFRKHAAINVFFSFDLLKLNL